jgi:hypothetical protein
MKLLLLLLCISFYLCSDRVLINKTDGACLFYELGEIVDITFDYIENEVIQIYLLDGCTDEINLSTIDNIEFIQSPVGIMKINKTDGSVYEIETTLLDSIFFYEDTSIDNSSEEISNNAVNSLGNFPNPFNPTTKISFELIYPGVTTIDIFNVRGQKITTILNNSLRSGFHTIEWDGIDILGNDCISGLYIYTVSVNGKHQTNKMLLLK